MLGMDILIPPGPAPLFVFADLKFGCVCKFNAHVFARVVRNKMATYEIGAFTEQELLDQGMAGTNIGYNDVFVMPSTTSVVMDVTDNDGTLSGDSWNNENANDQSGQTATITENGVVTSSGNQIYAECYHWVKDQDGNWYIMIEIEVEGESGDYFTFYGDVPPEGSVLTVKCAGNVSCNWVSYDCLMEPNDISPPLANDDAASVSETETATLNVLTNDVDIDGDVLTVTAVEGGEVGQSFEVFSSEGYSAMATLNADGSLTVVPGPEFTQLAEGETTTISFEYTITDEDGLTSTATVTVEVNGETTLAAADDAIIVQESEGEGDADGNVLDNDSIDGAAYDGEVTAVNGDAAAVGQWIELAEGGRVKLNADGSYDFDADGDFDYLDEGETAEVSFTYEIQTNSGAMVESAASIDFEGFCAGDVLSNQIPGVTISSGNNCKPPMIFDTANPTGGDWDLASATQGMVLIISEDGDSSDPDDNWSGGALNFDFDAPVNMDGMTFLDTEEAGEARFFDEAGNLIATIATPSLNDGESQFVTFDVSGVSRMEIHLAGSGAIDDISFYELTPADPIMDTATVTITVEGETDYVAVADTMTVFASEAGGDADLLDGGEASVLVNDEKDGAAYTGNVEAVNGNAAQVGMAVAGTNGGLLTINADGSLDFDANGEFSQLLDGQSDTTTFTYTIAGGNTANVTVTVLGETVREANDDVITVSESETFGDADVLDSGDASVLANDVQNGGAYTDVVGSVNGDLANVNSFVAGSNGGLLKVNADGTVDFDANGEFEALADGQTAQTTFTYTLISGEEATITVNVNGETDYDAVSDTLTVMESETSGDLEQLDDGSTSVLANDTQDGVAYGGDVLGNAGVQVTGSNGGLATIYADGTIDFDANDEFDYLNAGETATTTFSYEIAGGEMADVTVNIQGEDDPTAGGQVVNLAIMLSSAQTMYATAQGTVIGVPAYPDVNGDGAGNQLMDMAYLMLNDFMSDAFDVAAANGVTLNVSLISFDATNPGTGEGEDYWSVSNAAQWDGQLAAKVAADDSSDYGEGFANANAWFDTVATATSTNAVFVIGDGFTTGDWVQDRADLIADHGAEIDAYFPDLDVGSAGGVNALNLMDQDGAAEQVFTDDAGLAGSLGVQTALEVLDLNNLIA